MTDRILGFILLGVGATYAVAALQLRTGFTSDVLGPKAVPLILGASLVLMSLVLVLRPSRGFVPSWPSRAVALGLGAAVLSLVIYAHLLVPLGFLLSTVFEVTVLCLLYRARPGQALIAGVAATFALYGLFDWLLGLPLPVGEIFGD